MQCSGFYFFGVGKSITTHFLVTLRRKMCWAWYYKQSLPPLVSHASGCWWGSHIKQYCDSGVCTLYPGKHEQRALSTHNGIYTETNMELLSHSGCVCTAAEPLSVLILGKLNPEIEIVTNTYNRCYSLSCTSLYAKGVWLELCAHCSSMNCMMSLDHNILGFLFLQCQKMS